MLQLGSADTIVGRPYLILKFVAASAHQIPMATLRSSKSDREAHHTPFGRLYVGDSLAFLKRAEGRKLRGKVQLILTLPPIR